MQKNLITIAGALLASLFVPGLAFGQGSFDTVAGAKGAPRRGTITATTPVEITLDMSGVTQQIPVNEVTKVTLGDEPSGLTNARNAVLQKNYGNALTELEKVDPASLERDIMKQDVAFYRAFSQAKLAMTEGGNAKDAASAMFDFYKKHPNSFHFYEAAEILGDLAVTTGKFDAAATFYGEKGLGGAPWPEYKLKGNLASGRALMLAGKHAEALTSFEGVIASGENSADANALKQYAMVGKASCLAETGKPDEGIAMLNDIIAKNDPQDARLFARANNALGNCYLKASKPKDALMAFLKTDVLFFSDGESHAEALYRLGKLWDTVSKSDRAIAARNTLKERYAGSIWATMP